MIQINSSANRDEKEPAAVPTRVELCKADQVAEGTAIRVETAGLTLAVFHIEGSFYVTDDACTHGPCSPPSPLRSSAPQPSLIRVTQTSSLPAASCIR